MKLDYGNIFEIWGYYSHLVVSKGNRGGLRFGEMERDAVISHGASSFLRERLMFASDAYPTVFCTNCGTFAVANNVGGYRQCKMCGGTEFGRYTIPYAYKLLIHLLAAAGINLRPVFKTETQVQNVVDLEDIDNILANVDSALDEEVKEADLEFEGEEVDYGNVYGDE